MEKILVWQDCIPLGITAFCIRLAAEIRLGNSDTPIEPTLMAEIGAADLGGRFGWQGRWIVRCPSCAGAEYADPLHPIFMCCSCFNREYGHQWLKVAFPADRSEIERLLLLRSARNRNWSKDETVEQLAAENLQHGIGG
jgi:hypothetical protein